MTKQISMDLLLFLQRINVDIYEAAELLMLLLPFIISFLTFTSWSAFQDKAK